MLPFKTKDALLDSSYFLHKKKQSLDLKCFLTESRGLLDVASLADHTTVLLDIVGMSLESIIEQLLDSMLEKTEGISQREIKSLVLSSSSPNVLYQSLQGVYRDDDSVQQAWLCGLADVPMLNNRKVGIARLSIPSNLGDDAMEVKFFVLILCPTTIKGTKTAVETGRTFCTLLSDVELRHTLTECTDQHQFVATFKDKAAQLAAAIEDRVEDEESTKYDEDQETTAICQVGKGIKDDLARRIPFYFSDFKDGIVGHKAFQKTVSTSLFLYFSIILPAIAFGNLQNDNTGGAINMEKIMVGQLFGGVVFSLISGQHLVVVMTTAPLVLFTKIILEVANNFEISFLPFFAMVGLWNSFFLIIYALFNLSFLMKFCTRSTEEIFSNFITIALTVDVVKHVVANFHQNYNNLGCEASEGTLNETSHHAASPRHCHPEVSFLYLLLVVGTVWLGLSLLNFQKSPFLSSRKRELISDYALPAAVVVFSLLGSVVFREVPLQPFTYTPGQFNFEPVDLTQLGWGQVAGSSILGFSLSLLFFMDQNISAAMVNRPENKLKKGVAYHWDLVVVSLINAVLSIFGLPFMHAVLPHSPLHVRCLADTETKVEQGYASEVVTHVRETRLTTLAASGAIGLSMLFLPYVLPFVPKAVLDGLLLYMAVTPLYGNQMAQRVSLFVTEQSAYPPNHIVKQVPQSKIHLFTLGQLAQLVTLCVFSFTPWPYIKTVFPLVILVFLPIRHYLAPRIIHKRHLEVLDPSNKSTNIDEQQHI